MPDVSPRLIGYARQQLEDGVPLYRIVEELMKHGKMERAEAEACVKKVAGDVTPRVAQNYVMHMWMGGVIFVAGVGITVATLVLGYVFVIAWGAIAAGVGEFSWGYFGWRRCTSGRRIMQ